MREKTILIIFIILCTPILALAADTQSLSLSIPVSINESNTINDLAQIYKITPLALTDKISNTLNQTISENDSLEFIYTTYNLEPSEITEIAQNLKSEPEKSNWNLFLYISIPLLIICLSLIIYFLKKK